MPTRTEGAQSSAAAPADQARRAEERMQTFLAREQLREQLRKEHARAAHRATLDLHRAMAERGIAVPAGASTEWDYEEQVIRAAAEFFARL